MTHSLLQSYFCLLRKSRTNYYLIVRRLRIREVNLVSCNVNFRIRQCNHITLLFRVLCCAWKWPIVIRSWTVLNQYFFRIVWLNLMRGSTHNSTLLYITQWFLTCLLICILNVVIWEWDKASVQLVRVSIIETANTFLMMLKTIFYFWY